MQMNETVCASVLMEEAIVTAVAVLVTFIALAAERPFAVQFGDVR